MKLLSIAALLTLAACAHYQPGDRYTVWIDPALDRDTVMSAVDMWRAHVPVRLDVVDGWCTGVEDGRICVRMGTAADKEHWYTGGVYAWTHGGGAGGGTIDGADIAIFIENLNAAVTETQVIAHELGHAQGLVHEPNCLMSPTPVGGSATITAKDIAQWYLVRGIPIAIGDGVGDGSN